MYHTRKFHGEEDEKLFVHMVAMPEAATNAVEFHTSGVVLSEREFLAMVAWVKTQFQTLGKHTRTIH